MTADLLRRVDRYADLYESAVRASWAAFAGAAVLATGLTGLGTRRLTRSLPRVPRPGGGPGAAA
jgi:hypothetical protein